MTTEPSKNLIRPNSPVVDYQVHWYPLSAVEHLMGRSAFPKVERGATASTSSGSTRAYASR